MLVREYKDFESLKEYCNLQLPDGEVIERRIILDLSLSDTLKIQSDLAKLFKPLKGGKANLGQVFYHEAFLPDIGNIKIIDNVS